MLYFLLHTHDGDTTLHPFEFTPTDAMPYVCAAEVAQLLGISPGDGDGLEVVDTVVDGTVEIMPPEVGTDEPERMIVNAGG